MLGKDVGRVRPEVPDHVIRGRTLGELPQVILHLVLEIAPGEIGIRLVEPDLGERLHHLRTGEGFGEEDHVWVASVDLADHPLPEGNRLRVRIVDAEDVHAGVDPVQEHGTQLRPERFAGRSQPVEIDDVLVALGRILRRLDRPVRPPVEPLRMLLHVRMIRRALEGDVEGDLDIPLLRRGDEALEVLHGAELRVHRLVTALGSADRPGAADVVWRRLQRVVLSLTGGAADRVDGRQVDDVEPELFHIRNHRLRVAEGPMASRGARRAGEELVPRAEDGALALGEDAKLLRMADRDGPVGVPRGDLGEARIEGGRDRCGRLAGAQLLLRFPQPHRVERRSLTGRGSPLGCRGQERRPFQKLGMDLPAGIDLALDLSCPAPEKVRPRLDRERVEAISEERELPLPRIVAEGAHGDFARLGLRRRQLPPAEYHRELVVALLEHVGGDPYRLADGPFHGVAAAVDLRLHVLDENAPDASGHPAASCRGRRILPRAGTMWAFLRMAQTRREGERGTGRAFARRALAPYAPARWNGTSSPCSTRCGCAGPKSTGKAWSSTRTIFCTST